MKEIWSYFFKLGCFGFGGPLALVAEMQREVVESRAWMSSEEFNHTFAMIKAMPGPLAYQTAVTLGRARGGTLGGLVAGLALVLPSFVMMLAFGLFFDSFSHSPGVKSFLFGMQASALGVIVMSLQGLIKPYKTQFQFWLLLVCAVPFCHRFNAWEPLIIVMAGALAVLAGRVSTQRLNSVAAIPALIWVCFKAGAFVFGTGLAIVPLLQHDVVTDHQWLSHDSFMNALAFGQVTPGPVVITATYIGFKVAGVLGAIIGTLAIFAPSTFHMLTWFPHVVVRLSKQVWITPFVMGAIAAVVASILVTVLSLGISIELGFWGTAIAVFALGAARFAPLPVWTIIPIGGAISWFVSII